MISKIPAPRKLNQEKRTRNLLAYFLESKHWQKFKEEKAESIAYWVKEDPDRARTMMAARARGMKGYTIQDGILDILTAVHSNNDIAFSTKQQLYTEIEELEEQHTENGTIDVLI